MFEETLAEAIEKVFKDNKKMPSFDEATVYMEFHGKHSKFGQHLPRDPKVLTIIDVNLTKRGLILPRDFIKWFGHLRIPEVLYEGNFNQTFIQDVRNGKYHSSDLSGLSGNIEGVVAKGIKDGKKSEQHRLWMAKVKTNWWMYQLGWFSKNNVNLQRVYEDNLKEQSLTEEELKRIKEIVSAM